MKQLTNVQKRYTRKKTIEEIIEETEEFDDELLKDIYHPTRESIERRLREAEDEIERGMTYPAEEVFREMRAKYGY